MAEGMENTATTQNERCIGVGEPETIHDFFDKMTKKHPHHDACVVYQSDSRRQSMDFEELRNQSLRFAGFLLNRGLRKGDVVGLLCANSVDFFVAFLALSRIGTPILLLRYGSTAEEIQGLLLKYCCRLLLGSAYSEEDVATLRDIETQTRRGEMHGYFGVLRLGTIASKCVVKGNEADDKYVSFSEKTPTKLERGNDSSEVPSIPEVGPSDTCVIFFTSGSSGEPKAIPCSHSTLIARTRSWAEFSFASSSASTTSAKFFNDRPLAWTGGFHLILTTCVFGACAVTMRSDLVLDSSEISFVMAVLEKEECTHAFLMNYQLVDYMHRGETCPRPPYLEFVVTVGQKTDRGAIEHILETFPGVTFLYHYGLSENGFAMYQRHIDSTTLQDDGFSVHEGIEIKLVDVNGDVVGTGRSGEICIRSQALFWGYHYDKAATQRSFLPGDWFRTGDEGTRRADDKIVLLGRKDDMIKRAGVKVFPLEVESVLRQHPGIKEVVVIGVPDERLVEDLCACVIPRDAADFDVNAFCAWHRTQFSVGPDGLSLAPNFTLLFEEYPKTSNGKTSRKTLREWAKLRLNLA